MNAAGAVAGIASTIRIDNVVKHFALPGSTILGRNRRWIRAVDGVSFELHGGKTLALVGETGCGKTTTSRLVLRLEQPTSGAVYFQGQDIRHLRGIGLRKYRSLVQAVFQDPWSSLDPRMRVRDIVAEPLIINTRMPSWERMRRVNELLAEVGLDPAMGAELPHQFSGGQRQRIAVARALTLDSQVIVLDEPVSSLDVSVGAQIMNLLKDLQVERGISYLLIAHNLATVRYLSHEAAVMYLGQIVEHDATGSVFSTPRHPYTEALISASTPVSSHSAAPPIILSGDVPSPANPPSGCRFHTRCPLRVRLAKPLKCEEVEPRLTEVAPGHYVACHFTDEMPVRRASQPLIPGPDAPTLA